MWHYVFILVTCVLCLCLLIIGSNRNASLIAQTSIEFNFIDARGVSKQNLTEALPNDEKGTKSPKRKIHIPKFMLDLYEERKRDDYGLNFSKPDIVRSVIPKNAGTLQNRNLLQSFEQNHLLVFDIPLSNDDETFLEAELRILTLVNIGRNSVTGVERSISVLVYNESSNNLHFLDERHIYHSENTWITFNMTAPVNRLMRKYTKNKFLKLVISVKAFLPFLTYDVNHFQLSLLPITEDIEHDYPILLLSYAISKQNVPGSNISNRSKRNVEEDYEEETNRIWDNEQQNKVQMKKTKRLKNTCKRKQLYVDFAEIQYDSWIVQPSGYEAYQCTGKCFYPVAEHLSPTKHAIVQALLHSVAPSRAPRSCCVPSKLDSISLLYVDERGVLTYRYGYNDMVVVECGCR